jgi:hypothetical protein
MRFACLVYFDPKTMFGQSAEANAVLAETGPYNNELTANGHRLSGEALVLPDEAMTVRVRNGDVGDRWSVHGDEGSARRLRHDRGGATSTRRCNSPRRIRWRDWVP